MMQRICWNLSLPKAKACLNLVNRNLIPQNELNNFFSFLQGQHNCSKKITSHQRMNIHISEKRVTVKQSCFKKVHSSTLILTYIFQNLCVKHPDQTSDEAFWNI